MKTKDSKTTSKESSKERQDNKESHQINKNI